MVDRVIFFGAPPQGLLRSPAFFLLVGKKEVRIFPVRVLWGRRQEPYETLRLSSIIMSNTNTNKTRLAGHTCLRLLQLCRSLKAWNLIAGLYATSNSPAEDLVHALATEARGLVLRSFVLTLRHAASVIEGCDREQADKLMQEMLQLDAREKRMAALCRDALGKVYHRSAATAAASAANGKENPTA